MVAAFEAKIAKLEETIKKNSEKDAEPNDDIPPPPPPPAAPESPPGALGLTKDEPVVPVFTGA